MAGIQRSKTHAGAAPVLRLVPKSINIDTVEVLSELLELARRGDLRGVALVAFHTHKTYEVITTGCGTTDPTFALGAATVLQRHISEGRFRN